MIQYHKILILSNKRKFIVFQILIGIVSVFISMGIHGFLKEMMNTPKLYLVLSMQVMYAFIYLYIWTCYSSDVFQNEMIYDHWIMKHKIWTVTKKYLLQIGLLLSYSLVYQLIFWMLKFQTIKHIQYVFISWGATLVLATALYVHFRYMEHVDTPNMIVLGLNYATLILLTCLFFEPSYLLGGGLALVILLRSVIQILALKKERTV